MKGKDEEFFPVFAVEAGIQGAEVVGIDYYDTRKVDKRYYEHRVLDIFKEGLNTIPESEKGTYDVVISDSLVSAEDPGVISPSLLDRMGVGITDDEMLEAGAELSKTLSKIALKALREGGVFDFNGKLYKKRDNKLVDIE